MVAIPSLRNPTVDAIYQSYVDAENAKPRRGHLGASSIGDSCSRKLWYGFRWAYDKKHDGRMLRLFQRGHREELIFIEDLERIGVQVKFQDEKGNQFGFKDLGGHYAGSIDGESVGFIEAPKAVHINEFKTANTKDYRKTEKEGVQKAKPLHYAQTNVYMHYRKRDRAYYMMLCKETDEIYGERINYDQKFAIQLRAKAQRIIESKEPLPKLSEKADWYECNFCDYKPVCHGDTLPDVNCRTCAHSTPNIHGEDAEWLCGKWDNAVIPCDVQCTGCDDHIYIPPLLDRLAEPVDADSQALKWVEYQAPTGDLFKNGEGGYSSRDIKSWRAA